MRLPSIRQSIHIRLLASYFCLLLPMAAFGILWAIHLINENRELAVTETEEEIEFSSERVYSLIDSGKQTLRMIAEVREVQHVGDETGPFLTAVINLNPAFESLCIIDEEGVHRATAGVSLQLNGSVAEGDCFKDAMSLGEPVVCMAVVAGSGKATGRAVVPIASPLRNELGETVGVIAAGLVLRDLGEAVVEKRGDYGSFLYVVNGEGKPLLHPNAELIQSGKTLAGLPPVDAVLRGERGVTEYTDPFDGKGYLAVYRPVPSTPWGIVAVHPLALIDSAKRDTAIAAGVAVSFSTVLALLLAALLVRPMATSLERLASAARSIGEGKLGSTVNIKRSDEIGTLAHAFNSMSLDLADLVSKLEEAHKDLERAYLEVGDALTSGLDLRLTLEVAMRSAADRLRMDAALVGLLDGNGTRLRWVASIGSEIEMVVDATVDVAEADPLVQQAIRTMAPAESVQNSPAARVAVALPLVSRDQCLGVFMLYGKKDRPALTDEELIGAQSFANQVAIGIANATAHAEIERLVGDLRSSNQLVLAQNEELQAQNEEIQAQSEELQSQSEEIGAANIELLTKNEELQRLQEEAQSHVNRLLAIGEVSSAVSSSLDLGEICQQAVESTVRVVGSRVGALYVADWQMKTLELRALVGAPEEYMKAFQILPIDDQGLCAKAALTGKPQVSGVASPLPLTRQVNEILNVNTYVMVPIFCRGEVVGVMSVSGPHDRHADREEVDLLMTIANQVGVAIENGVLYRQVTEVDRLKDEFMSIASHELKSPLTSIKGYAQLLLRRAQRAGMEESELRGLKVINDQIDRMTRLVNELLDASRIEAGRLELLHRSIDLGHLLREVVESVQITTDKHQLQLQLPAAEITGVWDGGRLEEVVLNLLENAVKYSPESSRIWVRAAVGREEVEVSVRDEGIGIPKSSMPHLFERFFQASNVDHSNFGGLGLGLYVSHQIILHHGGRMWAESEEGKGSTFYFTLPL